MVYTGASGATGGGESAGVYHGFNPTDVEQDRFVRWFRKVDEEMIGFLAGEQSPLVLAGVEYYFPLYTSAIFVPSE